MASSMVGPSSRSITRSRPSASWTAGTGYPHDRTYRMMSASKATSRAASLAGRYRRSTLPSPQSNTSALRPLAISAPGSATTAHYRRPFLAPRWPQEGHRRAKNRRASVRRDLVPVGDLPVAAGDLEDAVVVLHGEVRIAVDRQLVQRDRSGLPHLAAVDRHVRAGRVEHAGHGADVAAGADVE